MEVRSPPPPPQKGYLSDTCAIPYENKANGCDTPLCDTISKGYCAIWGDISHWAAKGDPDIDFMTSFGAFSPGRNYIRPPPPPTPFLAKRHFPGEGGGGVYFEAPRGRNFIRPPLLYTPHP